MTRQEQLDEIERQKLILENQNKTMDELKDLRREVLILRKGQELFVYEDEVEGHEDVEDIPDKVVEE